MSEFLVRMNFSSQSDAVFETYALGIAVGMTNNPAFPSPPVPIAALVLANQQFSAALAASVSKDKVKLSAKRDARQAVESILRPLGKYVNYVSPDYTTALTSGFKISTGSKTSSTIAKPASFAVTHGDNAGEMVLAMAPVKGKQCYIFLVAPAPVTNDLWKVYISGTATETIKDLGTMPYSFRGIAVGTKGRTGYSDIITKSVS